MNSTTTEVKESPSLPTSLELFQNYPNPFNPSTTIRWRQAAPGIAHLKLSNHLGQQLAIFKTSEASAGERHYVLDVKDFASGVYFYQVNVNGADSEIKKMLLLR